LGGKKLPNFETKQKNLLGIFSFGGPHFYLGFREVAFLIPAFF
jgi:hypothetical protein